jgi:hypothetical protein
MVAPLIAAPLARLTRTGVVDPLALAVALAGATGAITRLALAGHPLARGLPLSSAPRGRA